MSSRLLTLMRKRGAAFSPLSLNPTLWALPENSFSRTGGQFTAASSQYLSVASNADLQTGDVDFWVAGWVYLDALGGKTIYTRWNSSGSDSNFFVAYGTVNGNRFELVVRNAANTTNSSVAANTFGIAATGIWYFVFAYHDATNDEIGISVNGGVFDTASFAGGVRSSSVESRIGSWAGSPTVVWNGRIDNVLFGKNNTESFANIATTLYNSGNGLAFQDITSTQETDWGIVSGWLDNSLTADAFGSNTLTNNNGVTQAAGKVNAVAVDNDPAFFVDDASTNNNDLTQVNLANRLLYDADAFGSGKPGWTVDGVNDFFEIGPIPIALPCSFYAVVDTTNLQTGSRLMLSRDPAIAANPAFYIGSSVDYAPAIYYNSSHKAIGTPIQGQQIVRWKVDSTHVYTRQNGNAEVAQTHGTTLGSVDWYRISDAVQTPNMKVGHMYLFNGVTITPEQDDLMFEYLNNIYGIY